MSEYFTYEDLLGRVHTDILTEDPNCKTCSTAKCYNTYNNVQGISSSKYTPFSSKISNKNNLSHVSSSISAFTCDTSMLKCNNGNLINNDPYNIITKSISSCNPLNTIRDTSLEKTDLDVYNIFPFNYKDNIITKTKPSVTKPSVTKPSVTKPSVTKPSVTKPSVTKPSVSKLDIK
jgi:hypothetical protein